MHSKQKTVALIAVSLLLLLAPAIAIDDPEQTPEEKKLRVVKLTAFLEDNPLHKEASEARNWLTLWTINVPDITVKGYGSLLGSYFEKKRKYSSELFVQMLYGQAAFIIQNPDQAADDIAVYRAGLTSSLRAYKSLLRAKPKARDKFLDDLVEKLDSGIIDEYIQSKMRDD